MDNKDYYDNASLEEFIKKKINPSAVLFKELIANVWFSSIILLLFFLILKVLSLVLTEDKNTVYIVALIILSCTLVGAMIIFFLKVSQSTIILLQNEIEEKIRDNCKKCVEIKENIDLNAYNIVTYDQLLQIEGTVSGKNAAVYCYSTYRDDGSDIGLPPAEKIIEENLKRGVKYYDIFFEESPSSNKKEPERKGEMYVNLSEHYPDEYKEYLDFKIYKHMLFDVMIYRFGDGQRADKHNLGTDVDGKEDIEGYFGLNFPIKGKEQMCRICHMSTNCPLDFNKVKYKRTIYKKMPHAIAQNLYDKLKLEVAIEEERRKRVNL